MRTLEQKEAVKSMGVRNTLVKSLAGSGKTTVAVDHFLQNQGLYLVFSKEMSLEAEKKVRNGVDVRTIHANSYATFAKGVGKRLKIDSFKYYRICKKLGSGKLTSRLTKAMEWKMVRLCSDEEALDAFVWKPNQRQLVNKLLPLAMKESRKEALGGKPTFTEMLYYSVMEGFTPKSYDTLVVDEAQDLNPLMLSYIKGIPSRLKSFVGDPNQSIMGFAGAMTDSIERIESEFKLSRANLTVNFRCGRAIIEEAQKLVPEITAWEGAEDGIVRRGEESFMPERGAMMIARKNKSLIPWAIKCLGAHMPVYIKGRDIEAEIRRIHAIAEKGKNYEIALQNNLEKEVKNLKSWAQKEVIDNHEAVMAIYNAGSVDSFLKEAFKNKKDAVILTSGHRAKGLEANQVCLINSESLRVHQDTEDMRTQEKNLEYVMKTRAKKEMVYL